MVNSRTFQTGSRTLAQIMTCIHHFQAAAVNGYSNNHTLKCVLYMLHMRYPNAKHHNMAGVTHPVACVQELLHKEKQANENSPLEYNTDISQALRDALSPDGPSPAITIGGNIHWRVMLINARRKHVDFVDPFGTDYLHSVRTSVQQFYQSDNTGTWTFTEWTKRLQPRGDTWNCGIWAIWIQEKWMQYWTQTEATEAFADWLQQDVDMIPEGQDLRQHYHVVMQIADTAAEDGMTDLCQSREVSASRMANQRDKQALYETYKERVHKDVNNEAASRWQTNAQRPMKVPDSPDIQATRNGHKQSRKAATTMLHRTGNSLPSMHTSTKMHGKIHKKPRCAEDCCPGCKAKTKPKTQARCIMTKMKLARSTPKLIVQQAASWRPTTTADTPISQVAYKHALLMQPLKKMQQSSSLHVEMQSVQTA